MFVGWYCIVLSSCLLTNRNSPGSGPIMVIIIRRLPDIINTRPGRRGRVWHGDDDPLACGVVVLLLSYSSATHNTDNMVPMIVPPCPARPPALRGGEQKLHHQIISDPRQLLNLRKWQKLEKWATITKLPLVDILISFDTTVSQHSFIDEIFTVKYQQHLSHVSIFTNFPIILSAGSRICHMVNLKAQDCDCGRLTISISA